MLPRRSSSVCSLTAPLRRRNFAHGNKLQTQVDGRGVERIDGLFEIHGQRLVRVQLPCTTNQHLGKIGIDSPIVSAVRIRQRAARNLSSKASVVQFGSKSSQACLDIAQTFAKRELRESQAQELIATREAAFATIAAVSLDASVELAPWQEVHELRKHELSVEHKTSSASSARKTRPCQGLSVLASSSRVHALLDASDYYFVG